MLLSNCVVYGSNKSIFIKVLETSRIIGSLPDTLNKTP